MSWHWRVRIYNKAGYYWHAQIVTGCNLREIDGLQEFYHTLTGCKMLLEGMSETGYADLAHIQESFEGLWNTPNAFTEGAAPLDSKRWDNRKQKVRV